MLGKNISMDYFYTRKCCHMTSLLGRNETAKPAIKMKVSFRLMTASNPLQ